MTTCAGNYLLLTLDALMMAAFIPEALASSISSASLNFSQTLGTAKKKVGCTS